MPCPELLQASNSASLTSATPVDSVAVGTVAAAEAVAVAVAVVLVVIPEIGAEEVAETVSVAATVAVGFGVHVSLIPGRTWPLYHAEFPLPRLNPPLKWAG